MRIWYGTLKLFGEAMRGNGHRDGAEVHCRVIVTGDTVDLDIQTGVDLLGAPRWRVGEPREIEPKSMLRALAETQPDTVPAAGDGLYAPGTK